MTDQKGSADAWSKVWKDAQKQYMDAWMGLSQGGYSWPGAQANAPWGMGAGWPGMQPVSPWGGGGSWADPMQQWSRMMSQALPKESRDVNTRLFDLGKSYMNMGETFWHLLQQGKDMAGEGCDWQELMQNAFAGMTGGLNKRQHSRTIPGRDLRRSGGYRWTPGSACPVCSRHPRARWASP